ncbi:TfoX/Sxy family protein [Pseudoruegeria sp. SK021]|uniref:TfoX/Sxy family protein n=1 Tax=Pseudoruegeria sp. SK021 TaxID=1933035 RepID=UPI000A23CBD7|nr:TfoX/Sxy family protein [Pseudoruegeria sp. SK021]OSP55412.1 competence protein TfoX [Pseudoruegeria sp. SK021]
MTEPVTTIRNVGPAVALSLEKVGITTAEDLRSIGAVAAYTRLLENGHRPHFIMFYALVMGLQGRPWNDCTGDEKLALRAQFDAIKSARQTSSPKQKGHAQLDAALAEIGVIARRPDPTGSR